MLGLTAVTAKPGGTSTTESPWLIQQAISVADPANKAAFAGHGERPPAVLGLARARATRPPLSLAMSCSP